MSFSDSGILRSQDFRQYDFEAKASEIELMSKATTTGAGIVNDGDGGTPGDASALRTQFLHGTLETALYNQDDAKGMKMFPVEKVYSTTVEFSTFDKFGGDGDGFVGESGSDGNFGLNTEDDTFTRRTRQVKFLATQAEVGIVAQNVKNIKDPVAAAELSATTRLITRANNALYFGDENLNALSYSGISAQIREHVAEHNENRRILIDAGGHAVDANLLAYAHGVAAEQFGNATLLIQDAGSYSDTEAALFPNQRGEFGSTGSIGGNRKEFLSRFGKIVREYDPMLRPNRPLTLSGAGVTGTAKATADAGSTLTFSATPWTSCALGNAGAAPFHQNCTRKGYSASVNPALPSAADGGNNSTRLQAKTYRYAVSFVYGGKESAAWVFGVSTVGTYAGGTGLTIADPNAATSNLVKAVVNPATMLVGGAAVNPRLVRIRLYRADVTPGSFNDFNLLQEFGVADDGTTAICFDNGQYIPGANTNYLLTTERSGLKSIVIAQLLPMMKRALPQTAMSDRFAMMMFITPILWVPNFQIEIRNVKSAIASR